MAISGCCLEEMNDDRFCSSPAKILQSRILQSIALTGEISIERRHICHQKSALLAVPTLQITLGDRPSVLL